MSENYNISLYVGSRGGNSIFLPGDKAMLVARAAAWFNSYSLFEGKGALHGKLKEIIRLDISCSRPWRALLLAEEFLSSFEQDVVGISHKGSYAPMTREIAANDAANRLALKNQNPKEFEIYIWMKSPDSYQLAKNLNIPSEPPDTSGVGGPLTYSIKLFWQSSKKH